MNGSRHLEVAGAGPAGLAAAITARAGGAGVIVYEKRLRVGARFHGDFQGIENWTTEEDALTELGRLGLAAGLSAAPVREMVCFDARGSSWALRSPERPIFYVVSRGPVEGTLDTQLAKAALNAGATFRYATRCGLDPDSYTPESVNSRCLPWSSLRYQSRNSGSGTRRRSSTRWSSCIAPGIR